MTAKAEQVLKQAMRLPPVDRAELIRKLFCSFDPSVDSERQTLWSKEVESRIDAYDEGKLSASPVADVMERINQRRRFSFSHALKLN